MPSPPRAIGHRRCLLPPRKISAGFATGAIYGVPLAFRLAYIEHYNDLYFMDAAVEEALALAPATTSAQASRAARAGAFPWHARRREAGRMLCHAAPALVCIIVTLCTCLHRPRWPSAMPGLAAPGEPRRARPH